MGILRAEVVCDWRIAVSVLLSLFFFFNDTATTEIYTLSLHDALPISLAILFQCAHLREVRRGPCAQSTTDRKSTRLNSSHLVISYAVFCLKKKTSDRTAPTAAPSPPDRSMAPARDGSSNLLQSR